MHPTKTGWPAGALPGVWPSSPDATFHVPVEAFAGVGTTVFGFLSSWGTETPTIAFQVGLDKIGVVVRREDHVQDPEQGTWGLPIAALTAVQPGVLRGVPAKTKFRVDEIYGHKAARLSVVDGPAVWLRYANTDWIIPTPDPVGLAREIDRRRRRVVRLGGFAAQQVWNRVPALRADLPLPNTPAAPAIVPSGTWSPLQPAPPLEPSPGLPPRPARPLHDVAQLRDVPDVRGELRGWGKDFSVVLGAEVPKESVEYVIGRTSLGFPGYFNARSDVHRGLKHLSWTAVRVVEVGHLVNVPPGLANTWFNSWDVDPTRADIVNGPAVWLWGHEGEFLLCAPNAAQLAAEIDLRRAMMIAHTEQDAAWVHWPDSKPDGPFVPPPPPYAPAEPTLVPRGCWRAHLPA
ncbi:hypothetical protein FKR81_21520 [Lentzea tibetensis]|uniref:Uncharacterized protein n=1 Tax=Lentzea tibetensis TaxID=2591470 RepID=A0A563ERK9_9PSEU|nr:hypothetical protein [Lentzea tibetensis]TWP50283.1 hypothetical protein FKR81_21520 [Lentzea tibetensis]